MTVVASPTVITPPVTSQTGSSGKANEATEDRFLKLLVAQMNNQDPLNPLDNAQVTSQMAQINTVNGIEKLNQTVASMMGSFMNLQAMQGASMVGRTVLVEGEQMNLSGGVARGGFEIADPSDSTKLEIVDNLGQVVETVDLGKRVAGSHRFEWDGKNAAGDVLPDGNYKIRIAAKKDGTSLDVTTLVGAKVQSVASNSDGLQLELQGIGAVRYDDVKSIF
jgi:flagellar basal-body rod modification protein FlgD